MKDQLKIKAVCGLIEEQIIIREQLLAERESLLKEGRVRIRNFDAMPGSLEEKSQIESLKQLCDSMKKKNIFYNRDLIKSKTELFNYRVINEAA